jgi:glycosyltransferase involved in cell wall biosynthesis/predicted metal-dependent phosphoesterase TrpH
VQRALGLPECATPPTEVYELAKRRGMDFVTITDHDTIDGALELADEPDSFISEELTASFAGQPQAVHVLCFGITPDDHRWLQAHSADLVRCAEYLHENHIACALAHPFFHVAAPLTAAQRRLLAELFPVWETRNGTRAQELNAPAEIYIDTHGGVAVGGSDDHAGVDIGRTFTEAPGARTPEEFLAHLRTGRVRACGEHGSAAKWAHSALVLAARALGASGRRVSRAAARLDAGALLALAERIMRDADARGGPGRAGVGREQMRALLAAWLEELGLDADPACLVALAQCDDFSHAALERRARRTHERRLSQATARLLRGGLATTGCKEAGELFSACLAAVPYVPASALLARERAKLAKADGEPVRVALVADGLDAVHGVARTIAQLRDRGVEGYRLELIGTDANVDRRLPAVAESEVALYPGLKLGVPSLLAVSDALTERPYDLVHVCTPGPAGLAAAAVARLMGATLVGSHHTELEAYVRLRGADERAAMAVRAAMAALYGRCEVVFSPSAFADCSLTELGIASERIHRWGRGVDLERFSPAVGERELRPDRIVILYIGRLSREKGIDLLADAFLLARERDRRLHLLVAGGGPEEEHLRRRLGEAATFLGWVEHEALGGVYAGADVLLFPSVTDTFGQVILEAQASGLPVLAVDAGASAELIEDGRTGCLAPADPTALAQALCALARRRLLRDRLAAGGLAVAANHSWERSLEQLAAGYGRALGRRRKAVRDGPESCRATTVRARQAA